MSPANNLSEVVHLLLLVVVGKLIEDLIPILGLHVSVVLESLSTNSSSQFHVLFHHSDSVCVDGAQV